MINKKQQHLDTGYMESPQPGGPSNEGLADIFIDFAFVASNLTLQKSENVDFQDLNGYRNV